MAHEYSTGALRSEKLPEYRLIPHAALLHEAKAFTRGAENYEKAPDGSPSPLTSNWRKGDLQFYLDAANHLTAHVLRFNNNLLELGLLPATEENFGPDYRIDDLLEDLGHARANTAMLIEWLDSGAGVLHLQEEAARMVSLSAGEGVTTTNDSTMAQPATAEEKEDTPPVAATQYPASFAGLVRRLANLSPV